MGALSNATITKDKLNYGILRTRIYFMMNNFKNITSLVYECSSTDFFLIEKLNV